MITCKWPGLIVKGDDIPVDLALEINLRTSYWPPSTNAHDYASALVERAIGRRPKALWDFKDGKEAASALGALDLCHLRNAWLASCWIGGPHGWCRPDGRIWCNSHNIGKWPSEEAVEADLRAIARTWPMLRFRVQVLDREHSETGPATVTDQWNVSDGNVLAEPPSERLDNGRSSEWAWDWDAPTDQREIGIPLETALAAIDRLLGRR